MGKLININEYLKQQEIEKDYQKFLTQINKLIPLPTDIPKLIKAFYFTLRYLEGNVNGFSLLSAFGKIPYKEANQLKTIVVNYLEDILEDLKSM